MCKGVSLIRWIREIRVRTKKSVVSLDFAFVLQSISVTEVVE